ncbi:hypothetical protein [Xanthomonas pisi]|uniref:hypothetical protein n=1 Tax=Xanthomonas pisi TaxID=56457 RepID=UPI001FEA53D8|nr:hypothetical protein [Xanthomonas pisi]
MATAISNVAPHRHEGIARAAEDARQRARQCTLNRIDRLCTEPSPYTQTAVRISQRAGVAKQHDIKITHSLFSALGRAKPNDCDTSHHDKDSDTPRCILEKIVKFTGCTCKKIRHGRWYTRVP